MFGDPSKMNNGSDSLNTTLEPDIADVQEWLRAVHGTVVAVFLVASLAANLLLLYLVWKYPQLRYRSILVSLGVVIVDLLLPIFMHLQALTASIAGRWPFEDEGCIFFGYVLQCLLYVRWLTTGVIALDRFLVIMFPFWYSHWSKPLLITLTVLVWVVPLASNLPALVGFGRYSFRSTLTFCSVDCPEGSSLLRILIWVLSTHWCLPTDRALPPAVLPGSEEAVDCSEKNGNSE